MLLIKVNELNKKLDEMSKGDISEKSNDHWLTREETAYYLKCDLSTIHNWTVKGKLIKHRIGNRSYYKKSEIDNAIKPIRVSK